jgi:hypothetical protein
VIGVLSDQVGLPRTLALLVLSLGTVTVLGGKALGRRNDISIHDSERTVVEIVS